MSWGAWASAWVVSLIGQYMIAAVLYGLDGRGWKALYFVSAASISVAVLRMK